MAKEKDEAGATGEKDLLAMAMEAYGIKPEHIFHRRWIEGLKQIVIVTRGGKKLTYSAGDQPEAKLSAVDLTGEVKK
jgi:hypothetical protein